MHRTYHVAAPITIEGREYRPGDVAAVTADELAALDGAGRAALCLPARPAAGPLATVTAAGPLDAPTVAALAEMVEAASVVADCAVVEGVAVDNASADGSTPTTPAGRRR